MEFVTDKNSPKRAKDFVKCVDPECPITKGQREENRLRRKMGLYEYLPSVHCHPVF